MYLLAALAARHRVCPAACWLLDIALNYSASLTYQSKLEEAIVAEDKKLAWYTWQVPHPGLELYSLYCTAGGLGRGGDEAAGHGALSLPHWRDRFGSSNYA